MSRNLRAALSAFWMLFVCGVLLDTAFANSRNHDAAAEKYVADLVSRAVEILENKEEPETERRKAFRILLAENVDMRRLPAFLLGQYARLPDSEQKKEYLDLLQEFMSRIYFIRLQEYSDDAIQVNGTLEKNKGREVIVMGTIQPPERRQPISLDWWLLRREGDDGGVVFQVFDVRVAGIWLAQEQRTGFVSVIRNNRGSFDALLHHLRKQIKAQSVAAGVR